MYIISWYLAEFIYSSSFCVESQGFQYVLYRVVCIYWQFYLFLWLRLPSTMLTEVVTVGILVNGCWIIWFFFICWDDRVVFVFFLVDVVSLIDWFGYVELSLWPWDESILVTVYDLFYVLLISICWYFVENFFIYIHQGYWSVIYYFFQ